MSVALSHLSLNFLGGEEKLCLSFIEALHSSGYQVALHTVEKTDWASVRRFFGKITKPDREVYTTSSAVHASFFKTPNLIMAYARYLGRLVKLASEEKYDVIINTYGDLINSIADVSYVHFPIIATVDYPQTPAFTSPFKWKAYCRIYSIAATFLDSVRPSFLLTNSKFTQQVISKYLKREALVLHPPVDVQAYASNKVKRENLVITVSKFTPKRMLHRIPLIAMNTKNAKFMIVGVADEYSSKTIQDLNGLIEKCKVKDKVTLYPNVPRSTLIKLLTTAKVYLHVMTSDHFGISIIEAMAAGCAPIVHKSGGPWLDILDQQQGKTGFSYSTVEEAARLIDIIMSDESLWRKLSFTSRKRSEDYSDQEFQKKLNVIVRKLSSSH